LQIWFQNKRARAKKKDKRKRQEESPTIAIKLPYASYRPFDTNIAGNATNDVWSIRKPAIGIAW